MTVILIFLRRKPIEHFCILNNKFCAALNDPLRYSIRSYTDNDIIELLYYLNMSSPYDNRKPVITFAMSVVQKRIPSYFYIVLSCDVE